MVENVKQVGQSLAQQRYIATDEISTVLFLAEKLGKPLLAEGPAGVGKTELSKAWAACDRPRLGASAMLRGPRREQSVI